MLVKHLNQRKPGHDPDLLERYETIADGGHEWHANKGQWLPQHKAEPHDIYEERLAYATYTNHTGGILGSLQGYLFSEAAGISGEALNAFEKNTDGRGTHWSAFWSGVFHDALIAKNAFIWYNAPPIPADAPPTDRLDEERRNLGAAGLYLSRIEAEDVLDWEEDRKGVLQWVLFREDRAERPSLDSPYRKRIVWTKIGPDAIERWEWLSPGPNQPEPLPNDTANLLPTIQHGFPFTPVTRVALPKQLWAMNRLYDPSVALLTAENDLNWALHRAAHAIMVVKSKWNDVSPTVSAGYYIPLGLEDSIDWLEPQGTSFQYLSAEVQNKRVELFRVLHQIASGANASAGRARQSGTSKILEWKSVELLLTAYAGILKPKMREVVRRVADAKGVTEPIEVLGLHGWHRESLSDFLDSAALATDAKAYSVTFRKEVARRTVHRMLSDETPPDIIEVIEQEIANAPDDMLAAPTAPAPTPPADK